MSSGFDPITGNGQRHFPDPSSSTGHHLDSFSHQVIDSAKVDPRLKILQSTHSSFYPEQNANVKSPSQSSGIQFRKGSFYNQQSFYNEDASKVSYVQMASPDILDGSGKVNIPMLNMEIVKIENEGSGADRIDQIDQENENTFDPNQRVIFKNDIQTIFEKPRIEAALA